MASTLASRRQAVFRSVFHAEISQPTPYSTPSARFTEDGQPFGVLPTSAQVPSPRQRHGRHHSASLSGPAEDQIRWDRAWHTVTSRIQLPPSVAAEDSFGSLARESQDDDPGFYDALELVLYPDRLVPNAAHTEDVLLWHTQQVRHHFAGNVLPLLSACGSNPGPAEILLGSIHTLEAAHRQYFYGLDMLRRGMDEAESKAARERLRYDLHGMIGNSMSPNLLAALKAVMRHRIRVCLGVPVRGEEPSEKEMGAARSELANMVESLATVGLAGEPFQVLFAELMDEMMGEFIMGSYAGKWSFRRPRASRRSLHSDTGSRCTDHLRTWVENRFSRLAVEVLCKLGEETIPWSDVAKWREIALGRLAMLRIHELFDIVLNWPQSKDGLDDLRVTITTPQRRLQLTDAFSEALQRRLLHPGCSTLKILQVYISMIRTFHALDHSKVLLDRVVHSLQLYLRQRSDAIRIVVTGLLADPSKESKESTQAKLVELARLLNDPTQSRRSQAEDEDLDWDDMEWVPVPIDAAVNYKRPKSEDVVGTLISALGAQDIFIKEFQSIMGERLLTREPPFAQEIAVLKLLKKRYGENALQNCDVMLKDIGDSRRVNTAIAAGVKRGPAGARGAAGLHLPDCHSKILSRLFWPTLPREHFIVPGPVVEAQKQYEIEYEGLKPTRKLTWIDNMGTAAVELELQDRTVRVDCKTYHAAVIYAFGEDGGEGGEGSSSAPARRTATELEETLQMDDDLVGEALSFWVGQRVLRDEGGGSYVVMETLEDVSGGEAAASADAGAGAGPATPAKKAGRAMNAKEVQQRQVYWQFIKGMLTNSANMMPVGQIAMMLKMLIPDGFPWANDELQDFLATKVQEGELEFAGGKYKLVRK